MTTTQERIESLEADARIKGGNLELARERIAELERAAPPAQPAPAQRLSDEQRQALWDEACKDTPQNPGWCRHLRYARAIEAAICPPGYVVVPVEPTRVMLDAGASESDDTRMIYSAMIAAAKDAP